VVQVKKESVRNAIVDSARDLFSERGYHKTTLLDIAQLTGVSSLYSYFPSKLHLLYAVVEPWEKECFRKLEERVRKIKKPRDKLRAILLGVWCDIPMDNIGLANSLMEALASHDPAEKKPSPLLAWTEQRLMLMLNSVLPQGPINYDLLPNLIMMAQDGFVINRRLNDIRDMEVLVDTMCDILMSSVEKKAASNRQTKPSANHPA
jgi:AcrR family transcriptional regulator